jgi:hypothetical protein
MTDQVKISRELLERVAEQLEHYMGDLRSGACIALRAALAAPAQDGWIPVSERLPTKGQFIAVPRDNGWPPFAGKYSELDGLHRCLDPVRGEWWEFYFWTPLPPPPKESK